MLTPPCWITLTSCTVGTGQLLSCSLLRENPLGTFAMLLIYAGDVCSSFGMRPIAISWAIRCGPQLLQLEKLLMPALASTPTALPGIAI